jgi:hypothetical protein
VEGSQVEPGDALALIAEGQLGTRADLPSAQAAVFGYLMATDAPLSAFDPAWSRSRYGEASAPRLGLLGHASGGSGLASRFRLPALTGSGSESPYMLRIHSWCAAFVDWCVLQLLLSYSSSTALTLAKAPRTGAAIGLLDWGSKNGCTVFQGGEEVPARGDIFVLTFREKHGISHHTGIVAQGGTGHFESIEGNTTLGDGGNQGYLVARRRRAQHLLKGFVRLPSTGGGA